MTDRARERVKVAPCNEFCFRPAVIRSYLTINFIRNHLVNLTSEKSCLNNFTQKENGLVSLWFVNSAPAS